MYSKAIPVAKLIQIDDGINFTSNGYKACNFSLQIPYHTGSLTINTQGQFVFEKKINTYSACLTGKSVEFRDKFFSEKGLTVEADSCKNQADVTCSDLLFKGKEFEIMPSSLLSTHNSLTLLAQSRILNQGTLTVGDIFYCASKSFDHRGILDVSHNCTMEKGNIFSSTASSEWHVKSDWKAFVDSLFLNGSFNVGNMHIVGKNLAAEQGLHCITENAHLEMKEDVNNAGVIKVLGLLDVNAENIKLASTACIMTDNANLEIHREIENKGIISVKNHLSAHVDTISNAGKIEAKSSNIKADGCFYNQIFSTLSTKNNLVINTPIYFNLLGLVHAQSLTMNSALGLNLLGGHAAKNMNINSLVYLHWGLLLPKISSFAEMCSQENLWGLGESLFIRYVPYGVLYATLKNIYGTYYQGEALYSEFDSLRKRKRIGTSDVITLICSLKNIFNSTRQTFNLGKQSRHLLFDSPKPTNYQNLELVPDTVTKLSDCPQSGNSQSIEPTPDFAAKAQGVVQQVTSAAVSHYTPNVTTSAIINCNHGVAISGNNHSTNIYHSNSGASLYVNNTIDTDYGSNEGYLGAYNLNINAMSSYNSNGNMRVCNGNIDTERLTTNGPINAFRNITLKGTFYAGIQGDVTAEKIAIRSDRNITIDSHLRSTDTHLHATSITQHGIIAAEQVGITGDCITNYGTIKAPKVIITRKSPCSTPGSFYDHFFRNKGSIKTSKELFVDTGKVYLDKTSDIDATNAYFKCNGSWQQDNGKLKTERCVIDSKGLVMNTGNIDATKLFNVNARDVVFTSTSNVKAKDAFYKADHNVFLDGVMEIKQGTVEAGSKVRAIGKIGASRQIGINAKDIAIEKTSHVSAPATSLVATENINNHGRLSGSNLFAHAKYVMNDGEMTYDNRAHIKADRVFNNSGCITVENNLAIDALILLNSFGYISSESIFTNSIVDLNLLGMYRGNNICQNSFISCNKGILIPKFKSLEDLTAAIQRDPRAFAKTFVFQFIPGASKVYSLVETTASAAQSALTTTAMCFTEKGRTDLKNEGITTYKNIEASCKHIQDRYTKKNLCVSDVVPVLCQAKNKVASVIQVGCEMTEAVQLVHQGGQQVWQGGKQAYQERKLRQLVEEQAYQVGQQLYQDGEQVYQEEKLIQLVEQQASQAEKQLYKNEQQIYQGGQPISKAYQRGKLVQLVAQQACQVEQQPYQDEQRAYNIAQNYGNGKSDKTENGVQEQNTQHIMPIYNDCQKISKAYQEGKLTPLIKQEADQIKQQICQDVQQAYHKAYNTAQDYWNGKSDTKSSAPEQSSTPEQSANNNLMCTMPIYEATKSLIGTGISTTASILGPQFSKNTLFDIDNGLTLGVNGNSQSLYSQHGGISLFANNNSVSTIWGTNTGLIGGGNVSVNAAGSYSTNDVIGVNIAMTANNLEVTGKMQAWNNAFLKAHNNVSIDKEVHAKNITIHGNNVLINNNASIDSQDTTNVVATEKITNKGIIDGNKTILQGNQVVLETGSKVLAHGNDATVHVNATKLLDVQKEASVHSEGKTYVHSAEHAKIDGSITGNETHVQANTLDVQENAHISSETQTTVVATEKLTNKGTIDGNKTILQGNQVVLENGSKVLARGGDGTAVVNATKLLDVQKEASVHSEGKTYVHSAEHAKIDGSITGNETHVHANTLDVQKDAHISSETQTTVVATEKLTNKGTIDGNHTIVQGNEVVLENGSKVLARGGDGAAVVNATKLLDVQKEASVHSEGKTYVHSAEHAKIDGSITGNETHVQANTLDVQENAHISSETQTTVVATEKLTNKGTIDGNKTILQGNQVVLETGSKVLAHGSDGATAIITKELNLQNGSHIAGTTNYIDAQTIQGEKGNTITSSHGTSIKTNLLNNQGTIEGTAVLNFTGDVSQLERIGTVDHLAYSGTLENNIADQLAHGHNTLLDVTKGGSVGIAAQEQDVHFKDLHGMDHALWVKTEGAITCDKDLTSEKSIWLEAKGDVQHANVRSQGLTGLLGKNISSEGHVTREKNGENYTDTAETSKVSGHQVIIKSTENVNYKGTDVDSGAGGTQLYIDGKLIADALTVEKYSKTLECEFGTYRTETLKNITTTEDKNFTSIPTSFTSDGVTSGYVGDTAELHGTVFASNGTIINARSIEDVATYDVHIQTKETKNVRSGKVTEDTPSVTTHRKPITFNDESPTVLTSNNPISLHLAGTTPSITFNAPVVEVLVTKEKTQKVCREDKIHAAIWERGTQANSHDIVYDKPYSGTVNTNAPLIHVMDTKNSLPIIINATAENPTITRTLVEDVHEYNKKTLYSRPTPLLINLAALGVSLGTSSLGAPLGIGFKMALAGTQTFTWNAINNFVYCNGNYRDAAKNMVSKQALLAVLVAISTSGANAGANRLLNKFIPPVSCTTKFAEHFAYTATREITHGGIRLAGDIALRANPKEALKNNAKVVAASIVGITLSRQIGQTYGEQKIGPCTHKLFHTGVGALQGAILDGKNGAIAGAIGAGVAELIADIASPKPSTLDDIFRLEAQLGRQLTHDEFTTAYNRELSQYLHKTHSIADASKLIAATVAGLAQQDMNIAYNTATNAIDNNFFGVILLRAGYLYSAYLVNKAYEEEGAFGGLKQLGIEILFNGAFKFAGKLFSSADAAINAALNNNPGLKYALGSFIKPLTTAAEKLASTGITAAKKFANTELVKQTVVTTKTLANTELGKQVINAGKEVSKQAKRTHKKVRDAATKISTAKDKIVENVAEGLVEHGVPTSVLVKVEEKVAKKAARETARNLSRPPKKPLRLSAPDRPLRLSAPDKPLQLPAPVASEVVKETAGKIKKIPTFEEAEEHIFSKKHCKGGIMNLGPTKEAINDKLVEIIKEADVKNLLKQGPNNIVTKINDQEVTLRIFVKNDEILSYDAFMKLSNRRVDNKIYL